MAAGQDGGFLIWPGGGGDPGLNYGSLEMRRRIAAQLAAQKKGFPKNLGEGLTYLGESIGEAGLMARLEAQERANQAANQQLLRGPGGSAPAVTPAVAPAAATPRTTTLSPDAPALPGSVAPVVPSSGFDPAVPVGNYKEVPVTIDRGDAPAPAPTAAPPATVGEAPAEEPAPIRLASTEAPTTLPAAPAAVRNNITAALLSPQTAYPGGRSDYVPPQRNAAAPMPAGERSTREAQGWTSSNPTWASLDDDQKAAAMALMEANTGKNQIGDASNVLAAIHNRADREKQTVGSHVSQKIYQPTIEPAQEARLDRIVQSPEFAQLTSLSKQYGSGEIERPHKATHFLASEKTMLDLEAQDPGKYRSWRKWTGFDPATGQYSGVQLRDSSHAFLSPDGAAPSMERGPPGTPVQIARVTRSREGEPEPAQVAAVVPRGAENLNETTRGYANTVAAAFPGVKFTSGYRDPETNAKVGGSQGSQHIHRNAIDLDLSGLSTEQKAAVIAHARANGATGIGNYGGDDIHIDFRTGGRAAWGPSRSKDSLAQTPDWFRSQAQAHLAGETPAPSQVAAPAAPAGPPVRMVNAVPAEEPPQGPGSDRILSEVLGGDRNALRDRIATASLGRAGVVSDAPVPGMGGAGVMGAGDPAVAASARDRAAAAITAQPPPPAPTQVAGPVDPSMFSPQSVATQPPPAPGPSAITPAPRPTIQKAPLAPSQEAIAPAADLLVKHPGALEPPPKPTPMTPEENHYRNVVPNHPAASPQTLATAKARADDLEKERLRTDTRNQEMWRDKREDYQKRLWAHEESVRNAPKEAIAQQLHRLQIEEAQAKAANRPDEAAKLKAEIANLQNTNIKTGLEIDKAREDAGIRKQYGNLPPETVVKVMETSKTQADSAVVAFNAVTNAKKALDGGAITGFGADARLNWAKFNTLIGVGDKGNEVANTEAFRGAMAPAVGAMLKATTGSAQVSDSDRRFAEAAVGGNINLDAAAIRRLMDVTHKMSVAAMESHHGKLDAFFPGHPQAQAAFGAELPVPREHVDRLIQNREDGAYLKDFAERYGKRTMKRILDQGAQ